MFWPVQLLLLSHSFCQCQCLVRTPFSKHHHHWFTAYLPNLQFYFQLLLCLGSKNHWNNVTEV